MCDSTDNNTTTITAQDENAHPHTHARTRTRAYTHTHTQVAKTNTRLLNNPKKTYKSFNRLNKMSVIFFGGLQ